MPLEKFISNKGVAHEILMDLTSRESIHKTGIFSFKNVNLLRDNFENDFFKSKKLFSIAMVELWHREFFK